MNDILSLYTDVLVPSYSVLSAVVKGHLFLVHYFKAISPIKNLATVYNRLNVFRHIREQYRTAKHDLKEKNT